MPPAPPSLHHIRHATDVLTYCGKRYLVDPMLAPKGTYPGFEGSVNSELRNPLVDLPLSAEELHRLLDTIDAVLFTHLHGDHYDKEAAELIPKNKPIYVQNEADSKAIKEAGFTNVTVMSDDAAGTLLSEEGNVRLYKGPCQHGSDALYAIPQMAQLLGSVAGLIFTSPESKTVYFTSDTVMTPKLEEALKKHKPGVVVMNAGEATLLQFGNIICGKEDVLHVHELLPEATIVAVHQEAVNHCVLTRKQLRDYAAEKGFSAKVLIPADGETIQL